MGMDRNTIMGFVLIGLLMMGMLFFNNRDREAYEAEQKRLEDSIQRSKPKHDPVLAMQDSLRADSLKSVVARGGFNSGNAVVANDVILENAVLKLAFSSKGGKPVHAELKQHKLAGGGPVVLFDGADNKLNYAFNSGVNQVAQSAEIIFTPQVSKAEDGTQTLTFTASDSIGKQLQHIYTLRPNDYLVDATINIAGAANMFTGNVMNLQWDTKTQQIETDHKYELQQTQFSYLEDGDFDFEHVGSYGDKKNVSLKNNTKWIAVKQQFFINALLAKNGFNSVEASWAIPNDTTKYLMKTAAVAKIPVAQANNISVPLQFYYGPSDYRLLKSYNNSMEELVPFGSGIFSFVKYINRYFLLPVFEFISNNVASMGIAILILTLIIRLITSPILYRSYLSSAKMRVLKPEVDELREKFKDKKTGELDQQAFSMEQMKLWRSAGVSPMGGCVPALLQIPIFMSLFYFFQSNIDLRGKSFLWAHDLATYDVIAKLPFNIPFFGDHISLFAFLATITSFLISYFSMAQMQDNSNPAMKYMPYIFPIFMIFIFNSLPSALTWYYTVSNIITLILQWVIQKYVINHDKILAQINENKKKPVKKSKLAERIEAMQEMQKKMQEQQAKAPKK